MASETAANRLSIALAALRIEMVRAEKTVATLQGDVVIDASNLRDENAHLRAELERQRAVIEAAKRLSVADSHHQEGGYSLEETDAYLDVLLAVRALDGEAK